MPDQEIYVIGYDEIVLLLGLLGIQGMVLEKSDDFMKIFKELINNPSIGMIIIALDLPSDIIDYLINFKLNNRRPFIFYLPDIFQVNIEKNNVFLNKISKTISKIIQQEVD
ncbi:MAG: hypothetical protein EU529_12580 [Promethearchaeota archaeon]|nr:MAG: hypothetical protein EU529_12580 [Candidatus Lokiarchaeota archaeon]